MNCKDNNTNFLIQMRCDIEREIMTLTNILNKKNDQLKFLTKIVKQNCNHEWIVDNIDIYPEFAEDLQIKYCKHCLLNDNT